MTEMEQVSVGRSIASALTTLLGDDIRTSSAAAQEWGDLSELSLRSEAGALAWWRLTRLNLQSSELPSDLKEAYRFGTLRAVIHERVIKQVFTVFKAAGVDLVLVKGWAIARHYPEQGLRPYGDVDLVVRPEQYEAARGLLPGLGNVASSVDLHCGLGDLDKEGFDKLYARSQLVKLDNVDVRVLGPEDHLRVLCLHMLRHGAWRPLWLVDVAVAIKCRPESFDWEICFGRDHRRADWVACAIGLAHELLGAKVEDTPAAGRATQLPRWLVRHVLKEWGLSLKTPRGRNKHRAPMSTYLHRPANVLTDLRNRWPDPLAATVSVGGPFNNLPRWPFQLGNCILRTARFATKLPQAFLTKRTDLNYDGLAMGRH